jgi:Ca2+-binding EF-hand superfamily protein
LFEELDKQKDNYLSIENFRIFLEERNIRVEGELLLKFIRTFDKDSDFVFNNNEFLSFILSKNYGKFKILENNQNLSKNNLSCKTLSIFIALLLEEFQMIKELSTIIDEIKLLKDYNTYESFLCITKGKCIEPFRLKSFLKRKNYTNINDEMINDIISRLDRDGDNKISYMDFKEIFFPYENDTHSDYAVKSLSYLNLNKNLDISKEINISYCHINKDFTSIIEMKRENIKDDNENNQENKQLKLKKTKNQCIWIYAPYSL